MKTCAKRVYIRPVTNNILHETPKEGALGLTHQIKHSNRAEDGWIFNITFKSVMVHIYWWWVMYTSCKQMRKTIFERWIHVLHGDQTESRGDAGMRARAQRGTHDFHGKTRFLRKSTDIWLAFRYHHIKKRAPVFTNSHHTGSKEQWAYVALQQSPIDFAVLPFSSMLAWYYRDMVNNYIPF